LHTTKDVYTSLIQLIDNYQKIVEKDFIYYNIIAITVSGANWLTFRGEQVSDQKQTEENYQT
jgi:hypothetical protein